MPQINEMEVKNKFPPDKMHKENRAIIYRRCEIFAQEKKTGIKTALYIYFLTAPTQIWFYSGAKTLLTHGGT